MSSIPRQVPPLFSPALERRGRNLTAVWMSALAAACAIALAFQIHHFWFSMTDDAFISLRYSQRLLEGHGLTWNDMHPAVEGYSNLLWVLICAGLGALGMNLETAARLLGIVSTAAGIVAVASQVYRDYPAKIRFLSALIACLALSLSAPVAVWSVGGLEQPLLSAFLAWAAYFGIRWTSTQKGKGRDADAMGTLLGLALLTRADAALFTALFYAGAVLADGMRTRSLIARARVLPIPILFFAGQECFRHAYYGAWVPNTAYVKVAFTLHRLYTGFRYVVYGTGAELVFFVLTLIGCLALWIGNKKRQVIFLATVSVGWLLYILVIGGDIFSSYRHFIPAMALMGFLVAGCGLFALRAPFRFSMGRLTIFLVLTLLVLTSDLAASPDEKVQQGKSVGLFLNEAFGTRHAVFASDAAGVMPFFAGMEPIDPLGLNDYHIARHPTADRGHGWVGHELGDGRYVLDLKPDLVMPANFEGAMAFPADQQLLADPRFGLYYQPIRIDAGPPFPVRAVLYIRRVDGRLGIESSGNHVAVPAYLATMDDANSVRVMDRQVQLIISPYGSAKFTAIPLGSGNWKIKLEGAGAAQLIPHATPVSSSCTSCVVSNGDEAAALRIENTSDQPATLSSIQLIREDK